MQKLRIHFTKGEPVRYISHLDLMRTIERAIRRSKLPVAFSEGFNPHMKMNFATALSLGVTSMDEYMDIEMRERVEPAEAERALTTQMPNGMKIQKVEEVKLSGPSLMSLVQGSEYRIIISTQAEYTVQQWNEYIGQYLGDKNRVVMRKKGKSIKTIPVYDFIKEFRIETVNGLEAEFVLTLAILPNGSIKPAEVMHDFLQSQELQLRFTQPIVSRVKLMLDA